MEISDSELEQRRQDDGIEQDKEFEPHMMYHPDTGEEKQAETEDEHIQLGEEGWGHEKIEPVKDDEEELDEDDSSIIDLASKVEPERQQTEKKRTKFKLVLLDNEGELIEIEPEEIDSDFDIGFSEAGRSPLSRIEMRNNVLQLSDRMLSLLQVSQEAKGEMSALAIEMYKSIHEQFEFPNNLSYDYIKGQTAAKVEEEPDEMMMPGQPGQQAQPQAQAQAQPQQPSPEQLIEQIRQLPPAEALNVLEQVLSNDPEAVKLVQQAKQLPPEGQKQAVDLLLEALEGGGDAG